MAWLYMDDEMRFLILPHPPVALESTGAEHTYMALTSAPSIETYADLCEFLHKHTIIFSNVLASALFRFAENAIPTYEKRRSTDADDAGQTDLR